MCAAKKTSDECYVYKGILIKKLSSNCKIEVERIRLEKLAEMERNKTNKLEIEKVKFNYNN